jgi:predicted DCC family thiol-disulfide oxidoreductase YuxK
MAGITIIYDGDCPFCANYTALLRLRAAAGPVQLIDARSASPLAAAARVRGIDFDDSMLVIWNGRDYREGAAVHLLSTLADGSGPLYPRLVHWLTRTPGRARFFYPWLRAGRNLGLRLTGKLPFKKTPSPRDSLSNL